MSLFKFFKDKKTKSNSKTAEEIMRELRERGESFDYGGGPDYLDSQEDEEEDYDFHKGENVILSESSIENDLLNLDGKFLYGKFITFKMMGYEIPGHENHSGSYEIAEVLNPVDGKKYDIDPQLLEAGNPDVEYFKAIAQKLISVVNNPTTLNNVLQKNKEALLNYLKQFNIDPLVLYSNEQTKLQLCDFNINSEQATNESGGKTL